MLKKWIFILPFLALFLTACDFTSDDLAIKTLEISEFSVLSLELYADVEISQGEVYSLEIEGPEKMLDEIEVKEEAGELSLNSRRWITSSDPLRVMISAPSIDSIYSSHNTNIHFSDYSFDSTYFALTENSKVFGENIQANNLSFNLVQNSLVELSGFAENVDLKMMNDSLFHGEDFEVKNMSVDHNSRSESELNVSDKLVVTFHKEAGIVQSGGAEITAEYLAGEESGAVKDQEGNVLSQFCNNYGADECPDSCKLCPPCPTCSSLLCQTKEACEGLGFPEDWLE